MEPLQKKLRRWVLGENNLPNESILEQDLQGTRSFYSESDFARLSDLFLRVDRQLSFGFGYKYLYQVYKAMGIKFDEKTKKDFYSKSGYYRKLNQMSAAMTLTEFLKEMHQRFLEGKKDSEFKFASFEDFIEHFMENADKAVSKQKNWEQLHFKRRSEIMTLNSVYKEDKQQQMFLILDDRPTEDINNIVSELEQSNFSVSIYEKIFLIKAELDYINLMLNSYKQRPHMTNNALVKQQALQERQSKLREELERESANFNLLFKKPIASYYY